MPHRAGKRLGQRGGIGHAAAAFGQAQRVALPGDRCAARLVRHVDQHRPDFAFAAGTALERQHARPDAFAFDRQILERGMRAVIAFLRQCHGEAAGQRHIERCAGAIFERHALADCAVLGRYAADAQRAHRVVFGRAQRNARLKAHSLPRGRGIAAA